MIKAVIVNTPNNPIQSDAQDWGAIFDSILGGSSGMMDYGRKMEAQIINNNTVRLLDGVYSMQGHIVKIDAEAYLDLNIESGTLGMDRVDYIIVEYKKSSNSNEDDEFTVRVLRGTPYVTGGVTPSQSFVKENLHAGGSLRQEVIYSVDISDTIITSVNVEHETSTSIKSLNTEVENHDNKLKQLLSWMGLIKDYVVETGSNANGRYVKWNSGKLECWGTVQGGALTLTQVGSTPFYWLPNVETTNYPVNFVGALPNVTFDVNRVSNATWGSLVLSSKTLTKPGLFDLYGTSSSMSSYGYTYYAIGRWK